MKNITSKKQKEQYNILRVAFNIYYRLLYMLLDSISFLIIYIVVLTLSLHTNICFIFEKMNIGMHKKKVDPCGFYM